MFLSIFLATCRPHNITKFLNNLCETAHDFTSFEVLIKIDEGDHALIKTLEEYKKNSALNIKYLATPKLDGYYSLHVGYNELLKIIHPNSYFCWLLTDEIRIQTPHWDEVLKKYIGFFQDHIFRLKLSIFQLKNYLDLYECFPCPDNYAVTTKKWLELTNGWGEFWGPDSWHQAIDFYLALCKNEFNEFGIWRSIPIFDIQIQGQEAGQGVTRKQKEQRVMRIWRGWKYHTTYRAQQNFYRLAQHLNAHIYAHAAHIKNYVIRDNPKSKLLSLVSEDGLHYYHIWKYRLPRFKIQFLIGYKIIRSRRMAAYLYVWLRRTTNLTLLIPSKIFQKFRLTFEKFFAIDETSRVHHLLRKIERKLLWPNLYIRLIERRTRKQFAAYRLQRKLNRAKQGATDYKYEEVD